MPSCWARTRASIRPPVLPEPAGMSKMSVADELRKLGYKLEYEYGHSEDRTEVRINEKAGTAVRIEWMTIEGEVKGRDF